LLAADAPTGTAIVMRIKDRRFLHLENAEFAAQAVLPPASTVKTFALAALFEAGKLRASDEFVCSRHLQLNGHSLNCVHPPTPLPMNATRALAYSCNGALAHFALRFGMDELPQALIRYGFTSQTALLTIPEAVGRVTPDTVGASCQLQALGEEGIAVTPLELLLAYARLFGHMNDAIRAGLEGSVAYGTSQAAQLRQVQVSGKTGSIVLHSGAPAALFAGFAPSRAPKLAVLVLTPGYSGGLDAAPIAARLISRYLGAA
jgi:cell division protein FtsI/penicillin-binding protein 2